MGDIVEFTKAVKGRERNVPIPLPDIASSTSVKRNWHTLAVELYANGYTADFISRMNRDARRELIIKSLPPNERHFFLMVLNDRAKLLGKKSSYGFLPTSEEGFFTDWEITRLLENICSKCHSWARNVKLNLQNLERQQGEISADLRIELIANSFKREVTLRNADLKPAQMFLSDNISQTDLVDAVQTYLERASCRERSVITSLYNMDDPNRLKIGKRLNYNSVAKLTGYTPRQVSYTHKRALRRAKHPFHKRFLEHFTSHVNPIFAETGAELFICDIFQLK